MKNKIYFACLLISALAILALFEVIPFHQQFPDTEEKTVDITHFDLHDNTSGSLVQGAMFAGMSEVTRQVVITAHLRISPADFGGVEFGIPQGWVVTEKYNSYPGGEMSACPEYSISEWYTGSLVKYNRMVRITPDVNFSSSGEGNEGNVVMVLQPENDTHPPDECQIRVSVGSEKINDISVIYPTSGEYMVYFSPSGQDLHIPIS